MDGTFKDNRQKTFIDRDLKLCWSFTGLTKINEIDCSELINVILKSKANIIVKLQLIENIMCYQTLQYYNQFKIDSIFDLFVAESKNNKIDVYILEIKNGISDISKNNVYHQSNHHSFNIASGVHTELKQEVNSNIEDIIHAPFELNRLIQIVKNESQKTDKTVGGNIYVVTMNNEGNIHTYINGEEKDF